MRNEYLLAVTALILTACQDAPAPTVAAPPPPPGADAARSPRSRHRVTPAEFHAKNQQDWIGVEHNAAMDDLRADIRRSRPKDLCRTIARISAGAADSRRIPGLSAADRQAIAKSVQGRIGCRGGAGERQSSNASGELAAPFLAPVPRLAGLAGLAGLAQYDQFGRYVRYAAHSTSAYQMSPAAWALADRIQAARGDGSPAGVAAELDAILADAQGLGADDQAVLGAVASVSLASLEYWNANADAMAAEMTDAYGDCIGAGGGANCYSASSFAPRAAEAAAIFHLASSTALRRACTIDRSAIWAGDKYGAGVGLAIGLRTGSVQGAIAGLIVGAAAGSGGAAAYEFGGFIACALK